MAWNKPVWFDMPIKSIYQSLRKSCLFSKNYVLEILPMRKYELWSVCDTKKEKEKENKEIPPSERNAWKSCLLYAFEIWPLAMIRNT